MRLTPYGRREWRAAGVISVAGMAISLFAGQPVVALAFAVAWFAVAAFFRDPPRTVPTEAGIWVSPADGRVTSVDTIRDTDDTALLGCDEAIRLSIFLSVLDVHVNRAPCPLTVRDTIHRDGLYLNALDPESGSRNESNTLLADAGPEFGKTPLIVRQITGLIARRIVCAARAGDVLERGEQYGMIKFGSRTDVIVPVDAGLTVKVSPGDRVYAGVTVIAGVQEGPAT